MFFYERASTRAFCVEYSTCYHAQQRVRHGEHEPEPEQDVARADRPQERVPHSLDRGAASPTPRRDAHGGGEGTTDARVLVGRSRNSEPRKFNNSRLFTTMIASQRRFVFPEETLPAQISSEGARPGRAKRDAHAARRASIFQSCPKTRPRANQGPPPRRHGPALRRHPRRIVGLKTARVAENLLRRRNAADA